MLKNKIKDSSIDDISEGFKMFGGAVINMVNRSGENLIAHKIEKHMNLGNDKKVAMYLVGIFNPEIDSDGMVDEFAGNVAPLNIEVVKKNIVAMKAIQYLKGLGWKFKIHHYDDIGNQFLAVFPHGNKCYHSNWVWK